MSSKGRRLVFVGRDRVEVERFDVPSPGPGQVLVRVHRSQVSAGSEKSGILSATSSDVRRPMGYTTIGRVLEVGAGVDDSRPGDRVMAMGNHGSHWLAGRSVKGVDGQRKCPPKWPAKMSLELLAMVSGHSVLTVGRFIGGLSACMYFFAVSRWMASSRATLRIDRPLRFAFCTAFHLAV